MSGVSTGRKANDHAHRPRRIGFRARDPRDGRQRGSARCQMQKISTGKFHGIASQVDAVAGKPCCVAIQKKSDILL